MKRFTRTEIESLADRERQVLGLEELPIELPNLVIGLMTVPLHFDARSEVLDDDGTRLEGALFPGDPYTIAVEEQLTHPERMLFSVAHELGHYVLHVREQDETAGRLIPTGFRDRYDHFLINDEVDETVGGYLHLEWEANVFAASFLMPRERVIHLYPEYRARQEELAELFGVSLTAMQRRLSDLGLVPKWRLEDRSQDWQFEGIRLLHFSDAHLGVERYARRGQTRLSEFALRLDEIGEAVRKNEIDVVLFAGDAFKDREPAPEQLVTFAQAILNYRAAGAEVVLLVGNHDLGASPIGGSVAAHALSIYQKLLTEGVHILDRDEVIFLRTRRGNLKVAGLPYLPPRAHLPVGWEHLTPEDRYVAVVEGVKRRVHYLAEQASGGEPSPVILMAHLTVEGATVGAERRLMLGQDLAVPPDILDRDPFAYVALGHIHRYQHLGGRLVYSGSIDRVDFGERHDRKGFVLVDVRQAGVRFKQVPLANVTDYVDLRVTLPDSVTDPTQELLRFIDRCNLSDKVARMTVVAPRAIWNMIRQRELLAALEENARHVVALRSALSDEGSETLDDGFTVKALEPVEALREFLYAQGRRNAEVLLEMATDLERELVR